MRLLQHPGMLSQMAKPNYIEIANNIANETDPTIKQGLLDQLYVFIEPLTPQEKELFDYVQEGYIENNPAVIDGEFTSYVGIYYTSDGDPSK